MTAEQEERRPNMLERALEYLQLGYPIFPVCSPAMGQHRHRNEVCKNVGKRPLISWEAFQTRLPTINEVRTWWERWPNANIGMATGRLSGVVVLDADSGDAKKLAMEQGGVDRTPAVFTGKPGGIHFWLAHPGSDVHNFARRRPGLDFRGDGGYILVPPSLHVSGAQYRWVEGTAGIKPAPLPLWLDELLHSSPASGEDGDAEHERLDLNSVINGISEGGRDDAIWRLACKLRNDNLPRQYAEAMVRQAALACRPAFDEDIALEKVERAYKTYEPAQAFVVVAPEPPSTIAGTVPAGGVYPIRQVAKLLDLRTDDDPCLVDGILWANRVTWTFSDPNTGKTLFLLALLLHIAAGRDFCGRPVKQGPVLVIEEDSPLSVLAEYVEMLADIYEFDLESLPFYVNEVQGLRIMDDAGIQVAISAVNACEQRPLVVLLDACERLVPSDRFNTKELDPLTRFLQWCISEGITPAMIDHTNRDRPKKGEKPRSPMETLFGARAKQAISDVMLHFSGSLKEGGVFASFAKFRGELPPSFSLTFDSSEGFSVKSERVVARSPAEQDVMRFFNNSPRQPYSVVDLERATERKRRTLQRALGVLATRGWLIAHGEGWERTYEVSPTITGVFG